MAEVHLTPVVGTSVVFHQPAQLPLAPNAGVPAVQTLTSGGQTAAVHGQILGTSIIFHNPGQ